MRVENQLSVNLFINKENRNYGDFCGLSTAMSVTRFVFIVAKYKLVLCLQMEVLFFFFRKEKIGVGKGRDKELNIKNSTLARLVGFSPVFCCCLALSRY